jgi:hypothetical protein
MKYSISIDNKSNNSAQAIVYQVDPNAGFGQYSLVWLSTPLVPHMTGAFSWEDDYGFVWGEMDQPRPGVIFNTSQIVGADTSNHNQITLQGGREGPQFVNQTQGPRPGALYIRNDASVPMRNVAEGIAVNGKPVYIVAAQPNMQLSFDTKPQYWIAFGQFQQGELLNPSMNAGLQSEVIYGPPTQVVFPAGVTAMKAILSANNTWSIAPG